jgi:purine-binding chemotaxis protein CheW
VTESANNSSTPQAVKENVVDGVLQNYLDQLLVIATEPQRLEKTIQIAEELEPAITEPIAEIVAPDVIPSAVSEVAQDTIVEVPVAEKIEQHQVLKVSHLTDQASWSSQGVECLIFNVCGLKLAVPLLYLGGVHEVKVDDIKPLMGQPKWYLGMVHTDEVNLQVIDTANFIMPERQQDLSVQGFKYLIQLEKTPWAIACQSIDDTVRLEASEIKWRGDRGKRTWLAGTVIEKMCALVDVSGLLQRVESSCKPI